MDITLWPSTKRLQAEVAGLKKELSEFRESSLNVNWNLYANTFGTSSATNVTKSTALTLSAVYSALNILSDTLNIPVSVFKRLPDGDKQPVTPADAYEYQVQFLLHTSPSQLHTPSEWFKMMEYSRNIYGNGYSYILRDKQGYPKALKFVHSDFVRTSFDGIKLWYSFYDNNGNVIVDRAPCWDVIHVKAMS
jgi:HK97 family phage portal protein